MLGHRFLGHYSLNKLSAGLEYQWVDITKHSGRIGRLELGHKMVDNRVAQETVCLSLRSAVC